MIRRKENMSIKIILIISVISSRKKYYLWMTFSNFKRTKNIVLSMSMSTTWLQKISSLLYKQKTAKHFWLTLTACDCQFRRFSRFRLCCLAISYRIYFTFCDLHFTVPSLYFWIRILLSNARMEELKRASFIGGGG